MKFYIIHIALLSFILSLSCCMKVEETTDSKLIYPFITQTVPAPLYYYGTQDNYDFFSTHFRKYKVYKSNINDKYRFPFASWDQSSRVRMNVRMFEFIPQTVYESEKKEKRKKKEDPGNLIDNLFTE